MSPSLQRFAELLYRGDAASAAAVHAATTRQTDQVRPPGSWGRLLELAEADGWVWDVDWKECVEEVVAAVRDLRPARPLPVDWDTLAARLSDVETRQVLRELARAVGPTGETLVSLDRGTDSYPVALLPTVSLADAARLAAEAGGRVDRLDL